MADDDKDDGSDETRQERRRKWIKAVRQAFAETMPQTQGASIRTGADLDAQIAALESRCAALEAEDVKLDARLDKLEAGDTTTPPVEPPIEPPTTGKRYPDKGDAMCGVPAGTSLASGGGSQTISQAGAKISGKRFTGRLTVTGANVEIFNCEIASQDWWAIDVKASGCNIHHCTITSTATTGNSAINTSGGTRVAYCRFRGWENAFNIAGSDNVIEWNDSDNLLGNSSSHYDNLQADGGFSNLKIRNNRFNCPYGWTSATMIDNYFGKISDVTIENNWLGGGGMPCYLDASFKGAANAVNIKYLNNDLKKGQWGYFYWKEPGSGCVKQGNKDHITGANVDNA